MANKDDSDIVLSDDLLDILETELEELDNEENLSEKISKHSKLNNEVERILELVNSFISTINEIDDGEIELIDEIDDDSFNISDEIISIEKELEKLDIDDNMKKKLIDYKIINEKIRRAKKKVEESSVNIKVIN
jgi:oligoendopeptidase F